MTDAAELLGAGVWFQPGPATLVTRERGWVVLVPGAKRELIEAAWTVLGDASVGGEGFIAATAEAAGLEGPEKISNILFALVDGTDATVGVKGRTPIAVYTAEGSQQLCGTAEEPVVVEAFQQVWRIAFGELPPEASLGGLRLPAGMARIRGFVLMTEDPQQLADDARTALAEQIEQDGRSIETEEAKAKRAAAPPPPKPAAPAASTERSFSTSAPEPRKLSLATRASGAMPTKQKAAPAPESAGPSVFDDLFGGSDGAPAAPAASPAPSAAPVAPAPPSPTAAASAAPAAASPASAPSPAPAAPARPASAAAPRRRLVSSSLFDRKRKPVASSAPSAAEPGPAPTPAPASTPAPEQNPAPEPAPPVEPVPEAVPTPDPAPEPTPAAVEPGPAPDPATPAEPTAAASPVAAQEAEPARVPSSRERASMPTPEPPEEDESDSPATLIEPIEGYEGEPSPRRSAQSAPTAAETPAAAPAPSTPAPASAPAPSTPAPASTPAPSTPAPPTTPAPASTPAPAPVVIDSDVENSRSYDDLFGKTVFRSIEDAAVRRTGEDDEVEEMMTSAKQERPRDPEPEEEPEAEAAPEPVEEVPTGGGDFIDWVPGVGRAAPEIAHTAARRAAQPPAAPSAYPQVHMPERPEPPRYAGNQQQPHPPQQPSQPQQPYGHLPGAGSPYGAGGGSPYGPGSAAPAPGAAPWGAHQSPPWGGQQPHPQAHRPQRPPHPQQQPPHPQQQYPQQPLHPGMSPGLQLGYGHAPGAHPGAAPGRPMGQMPGAPAPHGGYGAPQRQGKYGHQVGYGQRSAPAAPLASAPSASGPSAPQAQGNTHRGVPDDAHGTRAAASAPRLLGMICASGHANPPERSQCAACGQKLSGPAHTVARPALGAVAISTGGAFSLDRSAVIGRRPRASRVSGADVPQLVTVPSPQQDVSRSHLELRLEGWHVLAHDLGTTNGTTLHRAGQEPQRLRAREGMVLQDGDRLDLGDGVVLTLRGLP